MFCHCCHVSLYLCVLVKKRILYNLFFGRDTLNLHKLRREIRKKISIFLFPINEKEKERRRGVSRCYVVLSSVIIRITSYNRTQMCFQLCGTSHKFKFITFNNNIAPTYFIENIFLYIYILLSHEREF